MGERRNVFGPRLVPRTHVIATGGERMSSDPSVLRTPSVSSLLLTTDAIISEVKEDRPEPACAPGGGMGGMGRMGGMY